MRYTSLFIAFSTQIYVYVDYACVTMTFTAENSEIAAIIEKWFGINARNLPWRKGTSPWGILVSEFMSQQTQIERVAQRWPQLMSRFPTPADLARSSEHELLTVWQGLGYYRRAKYLMATAEMIVHEFGGTVPSEVDDLLRLPGVGKYTAGAIASIAFQKREPIVDGNVHRVLCRLADKHNEPVAEEWTWKFAKRLVDECKHPGAFNEGLMEIGATVCIPKTPHCFKCPLRTNCLSYMNGTQHEVPELKQATKRKKVYHYAVVLEREGKLAFEQRGEHGLWAGMWQVPTVESDNNLSVNQVAKHLDIDGDLEKIGKFDHILTHRIISFTVFSCCSNDEDRFKWINKEGVDALPLSSAQRKVLAVHCMA